jgi:hypothetical protein
MTSQLDFFGRAGGARKMAADLPEGFRYESELISPADEAALLAFVCELPFRDFEFHGYTGKRRVVSFGWHYDFSGRYLRKADDIRESWRGVAGHQGMGHRPAADFRPKIPSSRHENSTP